MGFIEEIQQYWGIIAFLLGLTFHAIWVYFQVGEHEKRLEKIEEDQKQSEITHTEFKTMVSGLSSEIATMNAKLDILLDGYKINKKKQ